MCGLLNTVTDESLFRIPILAKISCHSLKKHMAEAVTRDMASPDWWPIIVVFTRKSVI